MAAPPDTRGLRRRCTLADPTQSAGISPGGHADDRTEGILADLFEHLLATIVDTHSDASTQLALVGKATSLLQLIAAAYRQRQQRELDALVEQWAAQEQPNSSRKELIEAP